MPRVHSHYDNLKVARDAPPEVIRAAYRSLTLKYHPDRNTGSGDTARIMILLNAAYETLSDPARRAEHDRWIAENEADEPAQASPAIAPAVRLSARPILGRLKRHAVASRHWYGLIALALAFVLVLANWLNEQRNAPVLDFKLLQPHPISASERDPGSDAAPGMQDIPGAAGYIDGSRKLHIHRNAAISVDNHREDLSVIALPVALDGRASDPAPTRPQTYSFAEAPAYSNIQPDSLTLVRRKPE